MRKRSVWRAASLIVALVSSASWASAQIPSEPAETPSGDFWPSNAEHIPLPAPGAAETEEEPSRNVSPPTASTPLHATCTAHSEYEPRRQTGTRRRDLRVRRAHNGVNAGHVIRDLQVSFRCVFDAADPQTRAAP
jgi:hypothetical protein